VTLGVDIQRSVAEEGQDTRHLRNNNKKKNRGRSKTESDSRCEMQVPPIKLEGALSKILGNETVGAMKSKTKGTNQEGEGHSPSTGVKAVIDSR